MRNAFKAISVGLLLAGTYVYAGNANAAPPSSPHEMTQADVEAFLDGLMPVELKRNDIAGAVVCVVKDGKVLVAKGYGYSDVARKTPVSPETTLFRPGSISKLFTWTAVMQLVEQGKLDLDRDVNDYLDFRVPATFPEPITLRHIMTHTPGFEETIKELFVHDAGEMKPLDAYLKARLPQRIFKPGAVPAYSNYGTALAGYIVQRVSGVRFEDYIAQNILKPLDMKHATFVQPLPAGLARDMSQGYFNASGGAKEFEFVQAAPAGSLSTSATDIAHFMIAHLQDGEYNGARILKPATAQLMHARQLGLDPQLNAMALGFYEESVYGRRIIGHGGDTQYFHSDLHLMLADKVGFFVSYNSAGKAATSPRSLLWRSFLERYFPPCPPLEAEAPTAADDARRVAGRYITSRRSQTNLFAFTTVVSELKVIANPDNTVTLDAIKNPNGVPRKWRETGPLFYRDVDGPMHLAFQNDSDGRMIIVTDAPISILQRARLLDSAGFNWLVLGFSLTVIVLTVVLWPVGALVRRHYGRPLQLVHSEQRCRLVMRLACLLNLVFLLCFVTFFVSVGDSAVFTPAFDPWLIAFQLVGVAGVFTTVLAFVYLGVSRRSVNIGPWSKLHDTLIVLACLGVNWFSLHWHLIRFSLNY